MSETPKTQEQKPIPRTQINIMASMDVVGALRTGSIAGRIGVADNSARSNFMGQPNLQTVCYQGQVLNWWLYPIESRQRPDGTLPPRARIFDLIFVDAAGVVISQVPCEPLRCYGAPDKLYRQDNAIYDYWAGMVLSNLPLGVYRYRWIIECDNEDRSGRQFFQFDGPSLKVIAMPA